MAKALLGHLGGPDPRLTDEVRRLRRRVMDLETEIGRLLAERDLFTEAPLDRPIDPAGASHPEVDELDRVRAHAHSLA